MDRKWKAFVIFDTIMIALLALLGASRQLAWLDYEHKMCEESVIEAEAGTCRLEMDAPLEFHWYWLPEEN